LPLARKQEFPLECVLKCLWQRENQRSLTFVGLEFENLALPIISRILRNGETLVSGFWNFNALGFKRDTLI